MASPLYTLEVSPEPRAGEFTITASETTARLAGVIADAYEHLFRGHPALAQLLLADCLNTALLSGPYWTGDSNE